MYVKKLLPLFIAIPLLITIFQATTIGVNSDFSNYKKASIAEPIHLNTNSEDIVYIYPQEGEDLSAFLYTNTLTRSLIVDFYADFTGSREIANSILKYSVENDVPASLAFGLAWAESRFRKDAVNYNSASIDRGLFQLNSSSFPYLDEASFFDIDTNVRTGIQHLKYCLNVGGNTVVALAIYNAGHTKVSKGGTPQSTLHHISNIQRYRQDIETALENTLGREAIIFTSIVNGKTVKYVLDMNKNIT